MANNAKKNKKKKGNGRNRRQKLDVEKPTPDDLEIKSWWNRWMSPLPVRDYKWKVVAYRGNRPPKQRVLTLDSMVTGISWEDQRVMTCSITLQHPFRGMPVAEGHQVHVYVSSGNSGRWTKMWALQVEEVTIDDKTKTMTLTASDELAWLKKSKDDFVYKKGTGKSKEKRPHGWRGDLIVRDVCKRYGIRVGAIVKCRRIFNKFDEKNISPLRVIEKVYEAERRKTGFKYIVSMRLGKLYVTRLRRSRDLLIYGGSALEASITRRVNKKIATELSVTGHLEGDGGDEKNTEDPERKGKANKKDKNTKGDEQKKQEFALKAPEKVRRRYGYIHQPVKLEDEKTIEALRRSAKLELADRMKPEREVTLTVPGNPFLRRGDAVKVAMPDEGFVELMYVTAASHTVSPGDYTVDLTLSMDEYYVDKKGEAIREQICKKAKKKGHKQPWFCTQKDADLFAPGRKRPKKTKNRKEARR